jgi:hypothetical protein
MFVLRLSAGGVSFRHRSCVAGHGTGIRVVTTYGIPWQDFQPYINGSGYLPIYLIRILVVPTEWASECHGVLGPFSIKTDAGIEVMMMGSTEYSALYSYQPFLS